MDRENRFIRFLKEGFESISEQKLLMAGHRRFNLSSSQFIQIWEGWSTIASPCFWNGLFAFIHLIFFATMLVLFLLKKIKEKSERCRNSNGNTKFSESSSSLAYQATKACCLIVLASHTLKITLLILQFNQTDCWYQFSVTSEALQSISWVLLSVLTFKFQHMKCTQIPLIIRAWWTCAFFQAIISLSFDIHLILLEKYSVRVQECVNITMALSSTYLFVASVKGKTGITLVQNDMIEPLLPGLVEEHRENKKESLYGNASLIQLVTFSWMNPLFAKGYKKPLERDDVPELYEKDASEFVSSSFANILNSVKERQGLSTSGVYKAIFIFVKKKVTLNACFAVASACASYVGPSLINELVSFLGGERQNGLTRGYVLAIAFLSAKILETIFQRQWIFGARQLGMRVRGALISHIYRKGLRLSSRSKQDHTSGEIINYMSVDIQRITDVVWFANIVWMLPVQVSLAIFVLHQNLGKGAFAGLAATIAIMALNIPLTCIQKRLQMKIMASKDVRMKATSEVLKSMRILKLQAWDTQYLKQLEELRGVEYGWLWKSTRLIAFTSFIFWGSPAFISAITFGSCILMGIPLTAGRVLAALATFRMLQDPIFNLPDLLSVLAQGKVSGDRIASYLQEEEIDPNGVETMAKDESEYEIEIKDGAFSWETESKVPTLVEIQLSICKGMKVAICGSVGSGKSSLLSCILGEIPKLSGVARVRGTKAYVPQTPWILSGNVRENILFGKPYERQKYEKTIEACALRKDLELFANGDLTEIGERGINMSGGQKQRIQIARAVYQDADIYILDDPFSAVDAHTGSQLFKDCLMGILKEKTILYVTHQVEFLPAADLILVMQDGKIAQAGKFKDLLQQKIGFEALVGAHSQALESILNAESSSRLPSMSLECNSESTADQFESISKQESQHDLSEDSTQKGRLTQEEEREKGAIGKKVYWTYMTAVKGGALIPVIILSQLMFQSLQVASNYWIAWASPPTTSAKPVVGMGMLFLVYTLLSFGSSLCVLARAMLIAVVGLRTSEIFFKNMLRCILRAPMLFFDSTPTGRILNRASNDQSVLDMEIAGRLGWCAFAIIQILATVGIMSQIAWPVFAIFVPVTFICFRCQRYYISTARELARLSEIQRAPILHHFAESLTGAATIRAFDQEDRFSKSNLSRINSHSKPWFYNISSMEWLSFRLNLLSNFIFAFSLLLLVSLPEGFINPSIAGLAVTYALNLNSQLATIIWNICNTENKMISVERILQYSRIPSEAPLVIEDCRPPNKWPENGTIHIKNLEVRYAEHLPSVLRGVTCVVPGRKKIGVVGRTGSGKSTFIQALFRLVEPRNGTIEIDNIDICKIGLYDLRSRISIIPQEPTLFEGTVRGNLDPLNEYRDEEIWEALDKCQLGDLIRGCEKKLDSSVVENGENWSVGQRQLFCLGRVLLKRSNILVLDEATASIDSATDGILQATIRKEFRDCTVLTIAHRIHTVIDSDLILVLSDGRVLEYDTPSKLLEREDSAFSKLIKEYSIRSKGF
ncbi:putative ABC transporter C family member 15 [Carex rostrata]